MLRSETTIKGTEGSPWQAITMERRIIVDSTAVDPLEYEGTATDDLYTIPATTPMVPVAAKNGAYIPLQRSPLASRTTGGGNTSLVVDDASPFRAGDVIRYRDVSNNYKAVAIGTIASITESTNTVVVAGTVAADIAADDPIEVAYEDADMVLLKHPVCVIDGTDTVHDTPAVGVIGGQIEMAKLNMVGDWDALLARDMPQMDFIPVEPGTGLDPLAVRSYRQAMTDVTGGNVTATITARPLGIAHAAGKIDKAGFSLGETGADGTDALSFELDVLINAVSIFTTKPAIAKTATDGATTFAAGTGVTVGVIDPTANDLAENDVVTFTLTATRTTPETEAANLAVVAVADYGIGT